LRFPCLRTTGTIFRFHKTTQRERKDRKTVFLTAENKNKHGAFPLSFIALLASAVFAGALLWLGDCAIMIRLRQIPPGPAYLPASLSILLLAGVLLAMVEWLILAVSFSLASALTSRRGNLFRPAAGLFIGLFLLPVTVPVCIRLFSGAGISKWKWASAGPWLMAALATVLFVMLAWLFLAAFERWRTLPGARAFLEHASASLALAGAVAAVFLFDVYFYPHLYQYLHLAAALIGFAACQLLFGSAVHPLTRKICGTDGRGGAAAVISVLVLVLASQIVVFPLFLNSNRQRIFAWRHPYYHRRTVQIIRGLWDLDGDGYSPVLGGGDTCDLDPSIVPAQAAFITAGGAGAPPAPPPRDRRMREKIGKLVRETERYNIIIISIDALRADRITDEETAGKLAPWMKTLEERAILFTGCYASSSYTLVSMAGMFYSQICPWQEPQARRSLTERLRDAGYSTVRVIQYGMSGGERLCYLASGFEGESLVGKDRWEEGWSGDLIDGELREAAAGEIARLKDSKFFMWIHLLDVHEWPYLPGSLFPGPMSVNEKYDYIVGKTGEEVKRLLAALEENGIYDRTIVVVTADHGQGLGEHNIMTHTQYVYHPLIHVPLVIAVPGITPGRVEENVSLLDVAPTLLELAGLETGPHSRGISLVPALVGGPLPGNRPIISINSKQRSVIQGKWKLISTPEALAVELFNIDEDPGEKRDFSGERSLDGLKRSLWEELAPYRHIKVRGPAR